MIAVGLALVSALLFGGMSVGLRIGLAGIPTRRSRRSRRRRRARRHARRAALEVPSRGVHAGAAWPFALAGLIQPGVGQLLVTLAIREAGASRASIVFGAAPLVSVTIALVALGEPLSAPLLVGAVLIVAGGFELTRERDRPEHVRPLGLVFAFAAMALFSTRDNVLRWLVGRDDRSARRLPPPRRSSAAWPCSSAALGPRVRRRPRLGRVAPFLVVGVLFGLSYVALFEAYYRGRVTVVSPLIATESLWGVGLSMLLIRHTELVGRRLVLGALLVVAGGALIGAFR